MSRRKRVPRAKAYKSHNSGQETNRVNIFLGALSEVKTVKFDKFVHFV
jgi:hypothetical protein